ncbi:retrovirus-related Pol polyprotein from type-1 retrotransposable element R2 [Elysia marginata]|uniref:Retrovirus-related Pol polyprotein from type-1 retrotransposable element R2 n=1 Tax=Elysia marginata TaxID=1093978 RepID=A0AAV4FRZ7_9GAST|nr:retrovirus-related Pol polyprotein from type-1 retrotransposable element R2 [Elysia marginata]
MDRRESHGCLGKKGILIKLPKKGDLSQCNNRRGISLLSPICRVILYRIKPSVEKALRKKQAGFREGRSCIDQICILSTVIEQSFEWNSSTYISFIDFERAFDSVHLKILWKILQAYGIPQKIINILSEMYTNNQCCVRHGGQQSDWFAVKSGVRQGCTISPFLFLIANAIEWVMKRATNQQPRGITWKAFNHISDEDFADDLSLLSHSQKDMH